MEKAKGSTFVSQQIQAVVQEVDFMNAVRLLAQKYGGSVSFDLVDKANTANFDIPEDRMDSFIRDLDALVVGQHGMEVH